MKRTPIEIASRVLFPIILVVIAICVGVVYAIDGDMKEAGFWAGMSALTASLAFIRGVL